MAVTESELQISNKSYTNKDFESIYTELLDYANKLSDRFSPTNAAESDPFIVILKLAAFVADKVNYNVDKNILERFMLSCTQETSMRELTEMLGYSMRYYISAETSVIFKYQVTSDITNDIIIPQYSVVLNENNDIQYLTTEQVLIDHTTGISKETNVIQGVLKTLTILSNSVIQLENLDDNNRLYFPEAMVAENGIYISGGTSSSTAWVATDNLNTSSYGAAVYKFGYDSKQSLPYLEFPEWISDIIGDGLTIKYVVTDGAAGNVKAKALTSVQRDMTNYTEETTISDDDIKVVNTNAATSGQNPETIDESYNGFKKIIGTFDTLVACRDYANAIYNMVDTTENNLVSNVQVSDRRTDINYGCDVVTYNSKGQQTIASPISPITAYDLCIYPFKPLKDTSYANIKLTGGYNDSYNFLFDRTAIEYQLTDTKTMSHDYFTFNNGDILAIRNKYALTAIITTNSKINTLEQSEVLENIKNALASGYNARNTDFGYEIPYDSLLSTIENSDSRIKAVSLYEPEETPYIVICNKPAGASVTELESPLFNSNGTVTDYFKDILTKNILAGRISLFDFNSNFIYKYNQKNINNIENNISVTTECNIDALYTSEEKTIDTYILLNNEVIQLVAPSLITKVTYPYGINYYLYLNSPATYIPKNTEYKLAKNEYCVFEYTDSSSGQVITKYSTGDILKPNMDFYTSDYRASPREGYSNGESPTKVNVPGYEGKKFYTLATNDEVAYRVINTETLSTSRKCYWQVNNADNLIKWDTTTREYTLNDDEYLFITDSACTSLYAYESGTKLKLGSDTMLDWDWTVKKDLDITKITEDGLSGFASSFVDRLFTEDNYLTITEQQIITITTDDTLRVDTFDSTTNKLTIPNNVFASIGGNKLSIKLSTDSSYTAITNLDSLGTENNWKIRSILDLNCGPETIQTLVGNQKMKFTYKTSDTETNTITIPSESAPYSKSLKLDTLTQKTGGIDIDISYTNLQLETAYPTLIVFESTELSGVTELADNYYSVQFTTYVEDNTYNLYIPSLDSLDDYFMLFYDYAKDSESETPATFKVKTMNASSTTTEVQSLIQWNTENEETAVKVLLITQPGIYIFKIKGGMSTNNIQIEYTGGAESTVKKKCTVILSGIKISNGYNSHLALTDSDIESLISYMKTNYAEQFKNFYACADLDSTKQIETTDTYKMDSAAMFYDSNNIANKWVMSQIDFANCNISIAKSSKQ